MHGFRPLTVIGFVLCTLYVTSLICENTASFSVYWSLALTWREQSSASKERFELFLPFAEQRLFYIISYSCEAYIQHKTQF